MFGDYEDFDRVLDFGLPLHQNPNRRFSETYSCYSVAFLPGNERENVNFGGKIILPPSALAKLASLNIEYPMLFELNNANKQIRSHAGVLEFIAEEGRVYLPHWMMQTLSLEQGDHIDIKNATLPLGTFVKIQPQAVDFLDISDPKAVLEKAFRNFTTLTQGDIIQINYNNKIYEILVLEVKPSGNNVDGISIVETDLEVDFAPPVGYVEPAPPPKDTMADKIKIDEPSMKSDRWLAFQGAGNKLNGKSVKSSSANASNPNSDKQDPDATKDVPAPLNLPFGKLFFGYKVVPLGEKKKGVESDNKTFSGEGQVLRPSRLNASRTASPTPSTSASASAESSNSNDKRNNETFGGKGYSLK
ncbi:15596_t:CDS:10 [Acaulospora morrowiae]|uniref:Ubiquitin fusion degradation protein 1 n=1 Tax=Acaulospora morrowiae TaxID=94023 RepID=A0A9N8VSC9_9GLOM|nr:15596_t:CDS:10 [Acaulospora morrowiae]